VKCPGCKAGHLVRTQQKALLGLTAPIKLVCDKCGLTFVAEKDKFRLIDVAAETSRRFKRYMNQSFTIEQWNLIEKGAPVHYDSKSSSYVPYVPDDYSEPKPGFNPPLPVLESPQSNALLNDEKPTAVDLIVTSDSDQVDEIGGDNIEGNTTENQALSYSLTGAGNYLLTMTYNDLLETYHLLRCVERKMELTPEQVQLLLKAGLLCRNRRASS
jgi:hypothetical protein